MPKYPNQKHKAPGKSENDALSRAKQNIYRQAGLAGLTIVLTIVILFAMTSAWYTNIVNTSGLVFKTEAWGFDGEITVNEEPIIAAPGDDGLVSLQVTNNSDSISAISVSVSKAAMAVPMQQRLYFYVDTQKTRDLEDGEETVDRVYLSDKESYTYTVFNKGSLILTEEQHNDAQLKWQWVYDVLGYYVLGRYEEWGDSSDPTETTAAAEAAAEDPTGTTEPLPTSRMTVLEYLRPIEYDYDEATVTFETDDNNNLTMVLKTVDGETTVEDFLKELSKTDGYNGTIDPSKKNESGYYPVDVDETGYGVYAYMCNYTEIQQATQLDTAMGKAAYDHANGNGDAASMTLEELTHEATLTISAQKNENRVVNVSTLKGLQEAMNLDNVDVIQLSSDIAITETLNIPKNSRVMLDLNGHTINIHDNIHGIKAEQGSTLSMINGTIQGPIVGDTVKLTDYPNSYGIYTIGAEVILSEVNMEGFARCVYIGDSDYNNTLDSRVHLLDCNFSAEDVTIFISGNGLGSAQKTQLVVESSMIDSNGIAISGNGTTTGNGRWGTDIQILNGSQIISNKNNVGTGIYHPQKDSTLTIRNSTVSGYTGVAIKGGDIRIVDSHIIGWGKKQNAAFYESGYADTGDAVYIETNYKYSTTLEISGNSILDSTNNVEHGESLQVNDPDAATVSVKVYSGAFNPKLDERYLAEGSVQENGFVTIQPTVPTTEPSESSESNSGA